MTYGWSPDSKWLAYTLTNRAGFQTIQLYALGSDQSHPLTDGLVEASEPVFDASGKYLYFLASTDAGPVKNWFDQSNTDMQASSSVYLVTLAKATANPLLKESDEEGSGEADKEFEKRMLELDQEQMEIGKKDTRVRQERQGVREKAGGVRPEKQGAREKAGGPDPENQGRDENRLSHGEAGGRDRPGRDRRTGRAVADRSGESRRPDGRH